MKTYWHVAAPSYEAGDDLRSFTDLVEEGVLTAEDWRWEHALGAPDSRCVSLFSDEATARKWLADGYAGQGSKLVRVELEDDEPLIRDEEEGHPMAVGCISGACCTIVEI